MLLTMKVDGDVHVLRPTSVRCMHIVAI